MRTDPEKVIQTPIWRESLLLSEILSKIENTDICEEFKTNVLNKMIKISQRLPDDIVYSEFSDNYDDFPIDILRISAYLELAKRLSILSKEEYLALSHKSEKLWHIYSSMYLSKEKAA